MAQATQHLGARVIQGELHGAGLRVAVVVSRFNAVITERLLEGAMDVLIRHGVDAQQITVVRVPGAWELPGAVAGLATSGAYDGIVALGCLMRGDTIHFELIAGECAKGLMSVAVNHGIAVGFGVLTTNDLEQATHRAGAKYGNKGAEAALATLEQVHVLRGIHGVERAAGAPARAKRR